MKSPLCSCKGSKKKNLRRAAPIVHRTMTFGVIREAGRFLRLLHAHQRAALYFYSRKSVSERFDPTLDGRFYIRDKEDKEREREKAILMFLGVSNVRKVVKRTDVNILYKKKGIQTLGTTVFVTLLQCLTNDVRITANPFILELTNEVTYKERVESIRELLGLTILYFFLIIAFFYNVNLIERLFIQREVAQVLSINGPSSRCRCKLEREYSTTAYPDSSTFITRQG